MIAAALLASKEWRGFFLHSKPKNKPRWAK
jgi:hypothetical protein